MCKGTQSKLASKTRDITEFHIQLRGLASMSEVEEQVRMIPGSMYNTQEHEKGRKMKSHKTTLAWKGDPRELSWGRRTGPGMWYSKSKTRTCR